MKILGADLSPDATGQGTRPGTVVLLDGAGRVAAVRSPATVPEVAVALGALVGPEPFLLGVDLPVVVPERAGRARAVETVVLRRLGFRLPASGRTSREADRGAVSCEALLAALAVAGHPCLPFPDRDLRSSGLAEIHPGLVLKVLLWEGSAAAKKGGRPESEELFRALAPPSYRAGPARRRAGWAERASALDLVLRAVGRPDGYDLGPAAAALAGAASDRDVEAAGSLLDACLVAGTARRYLEAPESCLFLGGRTEGYVILPADGFVRRLALREVRPGRAGLFPRGSLRNRLGGAAEIQSAGLLDVPGRPQRTEAVFRQVPLYEFDNLDEMLWWKHCRHLSGPALPVEGLSEMVVTLGRGDAFEGTAEPLRLLRSRHRTLSFRFEPPTAWRAHVPTRDGRTYPFRVLRAVYETAPAAV